jgi:allantoate deiminase
MDGREIIRRCRALAGYTEKPGHITRTFLSPPMRGVQRLVRGWMEEAGMRVRVDAVGNVRGVYGEGPRLMIGSHLDTVRHAGAFDGVLGVVIGIALVARQPRCSIEVAAFSEEEGVRFETPFIGSGALVGRPPVEPAILAAIREFDLDPERMPEALLDEQVKGYLEFHIEQGPVLESLCLPLGVVEAIVGQSRLEIRFTGRANHAGATPMFLRHDAVTAAAEWIGLVEREASGTEGLVATVGKLEVEPGVTNVIAGQARASLDVRHAHDWARLRAVRCMVHGAEEIAERRGLTVEWRMHTDQAAVSMHWEALARAVEAAGFPAHRMVSGAGHDAMILAEKVPASVLFLRSPGGVSHHPDETVLAEDVDAALAAGAQFLESWRPS